MKKYLVVFKPRPDFYGDPESPVVAYEEDGSIAPGESLPREVEAVMNELRNAGVHASKWVEALIEARVLNEGERTCEGTD